MWWLAFWTVVAIVGVIGTVVSVQGVRFGRRVAREVQEMWTADPAVSPVDRRQLEELPPPVRRYLDKAIGRRERAIRTVRLRHGGTFRTTLDGAWLPIRGEQYFTADPPGFIWWGRVRMAPGIWVDARDRSIHGIGNMFVSAESTFTLADSVGAELDQGALLRLLPEMTWIPTVLLDDRYVRWSPIDDRHAQAMLRLNGRQVAGVFEFGDDDLPASFTAERHRDLGGGKSVLTPFSGQCRDYRDVDGVLVPHQMIAAWNINGQVIPYVRFQVNRVEFDKSEPF